MTTEFSGLPKAGLEFLVGLEQNNTKDWFQAHRKAWENELKTPMVELVEAINHELQSFAPEYVAPSAKKAISRINRDTRFSADKSPYKTQISAVFPRRGVKKQEAAGFFFGVSPDEIDVVGGAFMPGPPQLQALREHIAEHETTFRSIIGDGHLRKLVGELRGEQLKRAPKGFDPDHSAVELLRHKQFYFRCSLKISIATTAKLLPTLIDRFRAMTPFVEFLDQPLAK